MYSWKAKCSLFFQDKKVKDLLHYIQLWLMLCDQPSGGLECHDSITLHLKFCFVVIKHL